MNLKLNDKRALVIDGGAGLGWAGTGGRHVEHPAQRPSGLVANAGQ